MGFSGNVLKLDKNNNVEDFTFILSTKNYGHIGKLNNVKRDTVHFKGNLNSANELSFEVYKVLNGETEEHWDRIIDLKSVYVSELNEYFQIKVTYRDELNEVKVVTGTSLCEAELSQTIVFDTEINTEDDIARDDYVITKFYDEANPKASLLHRVLSKATHYSIKYVDKSLWKLQRSFSINGTSIYDFLVGECAEQFNCLFAFNSVDRSISVYDLYTVCADCGHRGTYNDVCPECGSTELNYFNEDTTIFVNKENLTDSVSFETDVDSIKNCFRLVAGDDNMTAAVRNLNQNGSQYIYYRSPEQEEDMSDELVNRLNSYDELYNSYTEEYQELIQELYDVTDEISYLKHEKMPESPSHDDDTENEISIATKEMEKLTQSALSPVGLTDVSSSTGVTNVNNAIKNYARVFVNTGKVKVEISEGQFTYKGKDSDGWDYGEWIGKIKVTNFSDPEDVAETQQLKIKVYDNYEDYLKQKVMKEIAIDEDEYAIFDVLEIDDLELFKTALKEYCLNRLESFSTALETALTTLQGVDQSSEGADFYEPLYVPYYDKLQACELEINIREADILELEETKATLESRKAEIQKILDFEAYLGEELYTEFCSYRREQEYNNSNYISDGLSNAEIMQNARDFLETAKKELIKSATRQHSISTNLYNLLAMEECKELAKKFALGNFIRVQVGEDIYRLRLVSYEINFSDLNTINVEFSDMTKCCDDMSDIQSVLSSAASMATTYNSVSKQAEKGEVANSTFDQMLQDGLNSALVNIKNNDNQEIIIDNKGITCKSFDDIENDYSKEQLRITHNILCFTDDNWRSTKAALGKHKHYKFVDGKLEQHTAYGLTSDFVTSGVVNGSQIIGGDIYSENYSSTKGTHLALNDGSFNFGHKIIYDAPTDKLTMKGVNIEWSSSTTPEISDIDGLNDELGSKVTQTEFDNTMKNYSTTEQVDAKITVSKTEISSEMNKQITETKTYADNAANTAQTNAINNTTEKLKSYSTTTEMNSAINQKADSINLSVSEQITETKTYANNVATAAQSNAIADTTEKLKSYSTTTQMNAAIDLKADAITSKVNAVEKNLSDNYSTTTQMNSAITQSANSITSTVSSTYETKTNASTKYTSLQSQITQNANNINLKVSTDDLVNQINVGTEAIELTGNRVIINSDNFKLSADGTIEAKNGTFSGAITGGSININNKFKVDDQGNVTLPSGTKLSWTDVTNQPTIPTNTNQLTNGAGYQTASQVTQITKDTITTAYVNALEVTAKSVAAENITGTTISGKTISGGTISGSTITIGSGFSVTNTGVMTCTGATVSGTVHLGIGSSLGGWKTDVNSIYSGTWKKNPTNLVFMCTGSTGTVNIANRSESWVFGAAPNFGVTKTGEMYCKSGEIGNWRFSESCLEGKSSTGQYFVRIYPEGKKFGSYTYYFAIFSNGGGDAPIGGITSSGWK